MLKESFILDDMPDIKISNLKNLIEYTTINFASNVIFRYKEKDVIIDVTYQQFRDDINHFVKYLLSYNKKNTHIALIGENSYLWMVAFFAVVCSGNVVVPIDSQLMTDDIIGMLLSSDSTGFVYSDSYSDVLEDAKEKVTKINFYVNMQKELRNIVLDDKYNAPNIFDSVTINDHDLAAIVYTSGTTGKSKGVMLTHHNFVIDTITSFRIIDPTGLTTIALLPFHHTISIITELGYFVRGCSVAICLSLKNILKDMVDYKPQSTVMIPLMIETMYKKLWDKVRQEKKEKSLKMLIKISNVLMAIGIDIRRKLFKSVYAAFGGNMHMIMSGGAPIDNEFVQGFYEMGIEILPAYGITECSPGISLTGLRVRKKNSSGHLLDCNQVKINNPDENGIGEIYIKGENVTKGYYNDENATREAFEGEWFKSGDLGYKDKDDFMFITGRIKNLIILANGKNVSPEELETKILSFNYVLEVLVYGENNQIVAELFLDKAQYPDAENMIKKDILELNRTLPQYKNINKTIIRDEEFPKTSTKKIKRRK